MDDNKKEILKGVLQSLMEQLDDADSMRIMAVAKKKKPMMEDEDDEEGCDMPIKKGKMNIRELLGA